MLNGKEYLKIPSLKKIFKTFCKILLLIFVLILIDLYLDKSMVLSLLTFGALFFFVQHDELKKTKAELDSSQKFAKELAGRLRGLESNRNS